jgi:hypothetical protein
LNLPKAYSKAKLERNGDIAVYFFRSCGRGNVSEKSSSIRNLLEAPFKQIIINLTRFVAIPNSMTILRHETSGGGGVDPLILKLFTEKR